MSEAKNFSNEVDELRGTLNELIELIEDIDDTLFHYNYSIVGWHLNGEHEPIMNFVADFNMSALTKAKELLKSMNKKHETRKQ